MTKWFKHPAYLGYAGSLPKGDERIPTFKKEFETQGWDSTYLWNIDYTFSRFVLPLIKQHKADGLGHPGNLTVEEWNQILDKMILAFELISKGKVDFFSGKHVKEAQEGLNLFAEYFFALWN